MNHTEGQVQGDILVVDDKPANLRLLINILNSAGHQVRPVRDGRTALQAVQAQLPDLILLDIMMPEMDGYEVCRRLKEDPYSVGVPVIFISALDDLHDKMTSFSLGAVDYITKPFQPEEVLARVNTHLALHHLQQQLREQVAELDAFAHTVAHDLKNPLAFIVSMADLLKTHYPETGTPEVKSHLEKIHNNSYRLLDVIEELLLLSSVRKQDVPLSPVDMRLVVLQARERIQLMLEEAGGELVIPDQWPAALGYAPWIEEVWINYLSNAIKYGGQPPLLELGAEERTDGMVRYWVRDNGSGLSEEKQAVLFTEFIRLNELRIQGYGLGLSIVRRIMDKLDGRVGVNSRPGEGSQFFFELPKAEL